MGLGSQEGFECLPWGTKREDEMMKRIAWIGVTLTIPILAGAQTPGLELYRQGNHAAAASALAAEVEKSPEDKDLLTHLGLARIYAGDPGGAVEPLKKAIALDDEYAEAHFGLGLANVKMKKRCRGDPGAREGGEARTESRLRALLPRHVVQPDRQKRSLDRASPAIPGARSRCAGSAGGEVVSIEDVRRVRTHRLS